MTVSLFNITQYEERINSGALILTPNRRIRAKMLESYSATMRSQGHTSWSTPNVHSLEGWVRQSYEQAIHLNHEMTQGHSILTADQEVSVWERVVQNAQDGAGILNYRAAAEQAAKAYKSLCMWRVSPEPELFTETVATEAFAQWTQTFESICRNLGVTPLAKIPSVVLQAFSDNTLDKLEEVLLVGFDDVPPVYRDIFNACADTVTEQQIDPVNNGRAALVPATDEHDEIKLAAKWAQSMSVRDPKAAIGIIVPDLGQRRDEVIRVFASILDPNHLRVDMNRYAPVFNVSTGEPLFSQPLVIAAIDILSLNRPKLSSGVVQRIMLSPLTGGALKESEIRAKAWAKIARDKRVSFNRDNFLASIGNAGSLKDRLNSAVLAMTDANSLKYPSEWAELVGHQLEASGWPGDTELNSIENQTVKAFFRVLHDLAGYDPVEEKISLAQAIKTLTRLVKNTPFQPETKDSPVQVLGALEGAGLNFDYVWVMGMRDDKWPAAPVPSPFIPLQMQRDLDMPNSSPERELKFTRSLTNRYAMAGTQVMFSYPVNDKENEVVPSQMVAHYPVVERSVVAEHFLPSHEFWAPARGVAEKARTDESLELVMDGEVVAGGTGLFRDYGLCAFRGIMKHRMKIRGLELPEEGIDHAVRGQLSHLMMRNVWGELQTHAALVEVVSDQSRFDDLLSRSAEQTVEGWERSEILSRRLKELEAERLIEMARSWLLMEVGRAAFKICEMESEAVVDVHGVKIKIKRDRVDELLADSTRAVIDYKENAPTLKKWDPSSLIEPQVPIGLLTLENPSTGSAALFGTLNREEQSLKGYATSREISNSVKAMTADEFEEIKQGWSNSLEIISQKIITGAADIDPISENDACGTCELKSICRKGLKTSMAA